MIFSMLKGTSGPRKMYTQMKEREKCKKKQIITDLNAPNGCRDIPFQSQEFGQDGHHHFVGFQPHFHLKMTSPKDDVTNAMLQDNEKMKVQYLRSLPFDLSETLQAVRTWQSNFASFQIS